MAKITTADGPSYPEGHAPGDGEDHVRPAGAAEAPEGAAEAPEAVPEALGAPVRPEVPAVPPKAPPRRTPPPGAPGE